MAQRPVCRDVHLMLLCAAVALARACGSAGGSGSPTAAVTGFVPTPSVPTTAFGAPSDVPTPRWRSRGAQIVEEMT